VKFLFLGYRIAKNKAVHINKVVGVFFS